MKQRESITTAQIQQSRIVWESRLLYTDENQSLIVL